MKKLFYVLAVVATSAIVACNNSGESTEVKPDTTAVEAPAPTPDSMATQMPADTSAAVDTSAAN